MLYSMSFLCGWDLRSGFILSCWKQSLCSVSFSWTSFCLQTHSALYSMLMTGFPPLFTGGRSFFFLPLSFLLLPINKMTNSVSRVLHSSCSVRRCLSTWLQPFLFQTWGFLMRAFLSALVFLISLLVFTIFAQTSLNFSYRIPSLHCFI